MATSLNDNQIRESVALATEVTGILSIVNGGTATNTLVSNSVLVGNGTAAPTFVAAGVSGNVLTSNGTTWASSPAVAGGATYYPRYTLMGA